MPRKLQKDELAAFLEDLRCICLKHRVGIGGCGCCGSPWIFTLDQNTKDLSVSANPPSGEWSEFLTMMEE